MLLRLTITHVPPAAATASWCRSMASISSVMLKATIGFLPVRSAKSLTSLITAETRRARGECGPLAISSSSLMKSSPAPIRVFTSAAVSSGERPTLGLTIVPMIGRPSTPASRRVPSTPNCGPGIGFAEGGGQFEVDQLQAGELAQFVQVARDGREQIRERRPHVLQRERQDHLGPTIPGRLAPRAAGARQARPLDRLQFGDPLDPRAEAFAEFLRLAGHADERPGRLLAGHDLGRPFGRVRGLDAVGRDDALRGHPPLLGFVPAQRTVRRSAADS